MSEKGRYRGTAISPNGVVVLMQLLFYFFATIPLRLWYRAKRTFSPSLHKLQKGALIISNHQSMIDPFFVLACLPFTTFVRLLPIRFPTMDCIYMSSLYNPRFFPLLKLLGCFSIGKSSSERMHAIFYIRELLKNGVTVFLFPEGEIIKESNVKELKQGVDFFIKDAPSVMFVRLHGLNGSGKSRRITFGEVFVPPLCMSIEEMRHYLEHL